MIPVRKAIWAIAILLAKPAMANYVGNPTNTFVPLPTEREFITIHSATTLGQYNVGLSMFGTSAYNSLPVFEQDRSSRRLDQTKDRTTFVEPGVAVGLYDWLDIAASAPHIADAYSATTQEQTGKFLRSGILEYHLSAKARFLQWQDIGFAGILSANFNQLQDDPYVPNHEQPVINTLLAISSTGEKAGYSLNIGYRYFNSLNIPDEEVRFVEPVADQVIWSAGAYFMIHRQHRITTELISSTMIYPRKEASDRDTKSSEIRFGHRFTYHQIAAFTGVGREIHHGIGTPSFRLFIGVRWKLPGRYVDEKARPIAPERKASGEGNSKPTLVKHSTVLHTPKKEFVLRDIRFRVNSDQLVLDPDNKGIIELADYLRSNREISRIQVTGHTDSNGPRPHDQDLSLRRANAVRDFIVRILKVPKERVKAEGAGEMKPIASNLTEEGRRKNRRVVIQVF